MVDSKVYVLAGGNLGDSRAIIDQAQKKLRVVGVVFDAQSAFYQSKAWGMENSPDFLNQAWQLRTHLSPLELLALLQQIESQYPRQRSANKYLDRYLDLDILYWNQEIFNEPLLKVPHPKIYERRFALLPLSEIAPRYQDPATQMSVEQLLNKCKDTGKVQKL